MSTPENTRSEFKLKRERSNRCGVTLNAGFEANFIADLMGKKPGVTVTKLPAMIRIDADDRLEFDMEEIADVLGEEDFTPYDFEILMSTHYGRMARLDNRVLLFANPEDFDRYLEQDTQG